MTFYNRNGMLYARFNGKRVSTKLKDTKANRKLFESYAKNDEFFEKFNVNTNVPTIVELCEEVLREKESTLKATSFKAYLSLFNSRIVPYFAEKLVTEFKPKDVDAWYKTIKDRRTIITCEAMIKPAFEKAIVREIIDKSPFIIKRPNNKSDYQINPFSLDEINQIIDEAPIRIKNLIGVLAFTGCRTGEILSLKNEDINFSESSIDIKRTRTSGYEQSPKTLSSLRTIDMISQCEFYLKEQQKFTGLGEYIFLTVNLTPYSTSSSLSYSWKRILKNLGLKYRSIYQLRHSFASNMLSNGEDLLWVSSMLGHKSPDITLKIYTKYIKIANKKKFTFLDAM